MTISLSEKIFKIDEYLAKLQVIVSCTFFRLLAVCWPSAQVHRLSNKPFLIWLLTTPPHLKPCNLSLMACFADLNVSQGSVAIYGRCGGIFVNHLTANLPRNLTVKNFLNRLRTDRIMVMSLWPRFLANPICTSVFKKLLG